MSAAPADIDVEENETQTPVSVTLGSEDQLLHSTLFLHSDDLFPPICRS
jgi:hypothetical protein